MPFKCGPSVLALKCASPTDLWSPLSVSQFLIIYLGLGNEGIPVYKLFNGGFTVISMYRLSVFSLFIQLGCIAIDPV